MMGHRNTDSPGAVASAIARPVSADERMQHAIQADIQSKQAWVSSTDDSFRPAISVLCSARILQYSAPCKMRHRATG
jgi:hypothetical protein